VIALLQSTGDFDCLVGADATGDAESNEGHLGESRTASRGGLLLTHLFDFSLFHFLLRELHDLVVARGPWRAALQQLARARARDDDELEPTWAFISLSHATQTLSINPE
jgi:hypothetical protein